MMPAKATCPAGWKRQYYGILTATHDGQHASSEYTCMDDDPEYVEGSRSHNDDGKLFYPVKFVCGSLPCPPYTNGAFVECAICTR
ncbi:hypothetical protein FSP39_004808 [Pinctada imbricata]|uniref:Uncharacterized protein n=1 Tax=Pinctada imbricata TaxID=66713 RepID=A0AA88XEN3_PINIB|nr:hypothetical protein FSP39_004808 [Pinctada imbricata]